MNPADTSKSSIRENTQTGSIQLLYSSSQATLKALDRDEIEQGGPSSALVYKATDYTSRLMPTNSQIDSDGASSYKSRDKRRSSVKIDRRIYAQQHTSSLSSISTDPDECKSFLTVDMFRGSDDRTYYFCIQIVDEDENRMNVYFISSVVHKIVYINLLSS
ncbi:hypothetical protein AHF37_02185 [Paragonimus kellicotti]|nr:hypothetical protein AHF37_02185 [Paragonimus kellicotti]